MKLSAVIEELVEEKGLDRSVLSTIISEGILAAYAKRYPELPIHVAYDKKTDEIEVTIDKTVVTTVTEEDREISLRKAKFINKKAETGERSFDITSPLW